MSRCAADTCPIRLQQLLHEDGEEPAEDLRPCHVKDPGRSTIVIPLLDTFAGPTIQPHCCRPDRSPILVYQPRSVTLPGETDRHDVVFWAQGIRDTVDTGCDGLPDLIHVLLSLAMIAVPDWDRFMTGRDDVA